MSRRLRYLTEIVHRRPREWLGEVDRLHAMLQSHGRRFCGERWSRD